MIKESIITLIIGTALFIGLNYILAPEWFFDASVDIFLGVTVEFFIFNLLLYVHERRQEQRNMKHLEDHLQKIENMIIKASIRKKEG